MKMLKKISAVILAVITVIGIFAVSASAAPAAPEFKLKVKSQSSSSVVFELSLAKGSVNSFDIEFNVSGPIGACKSIAITSELRDLKNSIEDSNGIVSMANNTDTKMISFASTKTISKAISLYEITFAKSSKNVTTADYGATFSSCVLTSGNTNIDMTSKVKLITGYIDFKTESISANYKQTKKIDFDSSYDAKQIKWESSNTKVATVDDSGNVKMTGTGTATITAKSTDGKATAECKVTVSYAWWQWIIMIVLLGFLWY